MLVERTRLHVYVVGLFLWEIAFFYVLWNARMPLFT